MHSVLELPSFTDQADRLFTEAEKKEIIDALAADPEAGAVIPGTGGIRKLRVPASGRGKRGGARVIYYHHGAAIPILALAVYAKNAKDDLSADEKRTLSALARRIIGSTT